MKGQFNRAIVYTDQIDEVAIRQITELCNQKFCRDSTIRIMPDVHAGAGCTIGTTMTVTDKVVPNLVGVDIGCGIEAPAFPVLTCTKTHDMLNTNQIYWACVASYL